MIVNPRGFTITLTLADTSYKLSDLIFIVDPDIQGHHLQVQRLTLQADFNAGGTRFYVGNSDLTGTNRGVELVATQVVLYEAPYSPPELLHLEQIYVRANAAGKMMNVFIQWP